MSFRAVTLILATCFALTAKASFFASPSFNMTVEGQIKDFYKLSSDGSEHVKFEAIKSEIVTDSGDVLSENFLTESSNDYYATAPLNRMLAPTGNLTLNSIGSGELNYRNRNFSFTFFSNFGSVLIDEDTANSDLHEFYTLKVSSILNGKILDPLKSKFARSIVNDIWISDVTCRHIIDQWVPGVGRIGKGLVCKTDFVADYSQSLLRY